MCLCVLQVLSAGVGSYVIQWKIFLKWERRQPRRRTFIILQEVGLKTGSDIPLNWLVSVNEGEELWASFSSYQGLQHSVLYSTWDLLQWSILNIGIPQKSLKKSWLLKVFVNYTCDTLTRPKAMMSFKRTGSKWPCPWMPGNYISRKGWIYPRSLRLMNEHYRVDQVVFILEIFSEGKIVKENQLSYPSLVSVQGMKREPLSGS